MAQHEPALFSRDAQSDQDQIRQFKRSCVREDVQEAQVMLNNFTLIITAKKKEPTY